MHIYMCRASLAQLLHVNLVLAFDGSSRCLLAEAFLFQLSHLHCDCFSEHGWCQTFMEPLLQNLLDFCPLVCFRKLFPWLHLCWYEGPLCYTVMNIIETIHYMHSAHGNSAQMPSSVAGSSLSFGREVNALLATPTLILVKILCSVALTMFARPRMCLLGTDLHALLIILRAVLSIPK